MELNNLYLSELEEKIASYGEPKYRAKQLFEFFHSKKRLDIENSNLPKSLKSQLLEKETIKKLEIVEEFSSKIDDTKKFLFELDNYDIIEGVLMKYKYGYSQCISTQVGCRMGCVFCASTKNGLKRNLTASEMLLQIYEIEKKYNITVSNIILMGCGEPLDNYDEVVRFLKLIHDENGKNLSYRNITVSTCGVANRIYDLAEEKFPITLALSLHETDNISRDKLMPINKKYNIEEVIKACIHYSHKLNTRITIEYTLINGKNDLDKNAYELKELLRGLNAHINLIPLNPIEEYGEKKPTRKAVEIFKKKLEDLSLNVTIRRELGSDINAACGQLRRNYKRGESIELCSHN